MIDYNSYADDKFSYVFSEDTLAKWKRDVVALSNEELLEDCIELAGGDDYDGCSTPGGDKVYQMLREELFTRLRVCHFLEPAND